MTRPVCIVESDGGRYRIQSEVGTFSLSAAEAAAVSVEFEKRHPKTVNVQAAPQLEALTMALGRLEVTRLIGGGER